jgi:hypothetical protein
LREFHQTAIRRQAFHSRDYSAGAAQGDHVRIVERRDSDAPERTQPYSQVARRNLLDKCKSAQSVRFEPVSTNRYGRIVAHVWCDEVHRNATLRHCDRLGALPLR